MPLGRAIYHTVGLREQRLYLGHLSPAQNCSWRDVASSSAQSPFGACLDQTLLQHRVAWVPHSSKCSNEAVGTSGLQWEVNPETTME